MPRVVLEAMSAGVPVVATRTRGVVDAIGNDAGWLVERPDAALLAAALDYVATHPEEGSARGREGQRRIDATYGLPRIISAYQELYDEALA
jgi:glycosyltransferase involved in cell wall biosynthesis